MLAKVGEALLEDLQVLIGVDVGKGLAGGDFRTTAVHLESSDGCDNDDSVGLKARSAALDVAEFLHTDVSTETSLGDDVAIVVLWLALLNASQLERDFVSKDRRVAVGNVGEGAGMNEDGCAFESLHQVWLNGVAHEDGERASDADVVGSDGLALLAVGADHLAEAALHVGQVVAERQDGHAFTGDSNVKSSVAGEALLGGRLTNGGFAEVAVVDIKHTVPARNRKTGAS